MVQSRVVPPWRRRRRVGSSARMSTAWGEAFLAAHEVQAPVDAVRAVDVRAPRGGPNIEARESVTPCEPMARGIADGVPPPRRYGRRCRRKGACCRRARARPRGRNARRIPRGASEEVRGAALLRARLEQPTSPLAEIGQVDLPDSACSAISSASSSDWSMIGEAAEASWPMSWRIVRSVRDAMIGSEMPSTHTFVRRPLPRSSVAAARGCRSVPRGRTSRSQGRPFGSSRWPRADYPSARRSVSATRSWSASSIPVWNGNASVRRQASSATGQSLSEQPYSSRMYG